MTSLFHCARGLLDISIVAAALLLVNGCASPRANSGTTQAATKTPARVISPEIGPDRRVTLQLRAPQAQSVVLTGEFMKGTNAFVKGPDGVWNLTIGPIE